MTSKARFQQGQGEKGGTVGKSSLGAGGGSKTLGSTTTAGKSTKPGIGAGGIPASISSKGAIQVIFNGKIVTPMSLLPKKKYVTKQQTTKLPTEDNDDKNMNEEDDQNKQDMHRLASNRKLESSKSTLTSSLVQKQKKQDENCAVYLCETKTETLFNLTSLVVASDVREVSITDDKNAKYENLIIAHKNPDGFSEHMTQTLNNSQRNQNEMAAPNAFR